MTEHNNKLIINGKLVVAKNIKRKGGVHGEEIFTLTLEDGSAQEFTQAELRRAEEANIEDD